MNITLSLDDRLVKTVRKIAVERDTTLTGLVRNYLEKLADDDMASGGKRRQREALEKTFQDVQYSLGQRNWKREDLYERD